MRIAEGDAAANEVVGRFGGQQRGVASGFAQARFIGARGFDGRGGHLHHRERLLVRGEERLLVFLEVALVAGGQALERGEEREERRGNASGLAADELPRVGIFLLRHDAAAGGELVGEKDEAKLLRGEQHKVFGHAREVRGQHGEGVEIVEREVAAADGVEAVAREAGKTEVAGDGFAVDGKGAARQRAGAHRAGV